VLTHTCREIDLKSKCNQGFRRLHLSQPGNCSIHGKAALFQGSNGCHKDTWPISAGVVAA
jgi:hypothetical protein